MQTAAKPSYPASDRHPSIDPNMVMIVRQEMIMTLIEDISQISDEDDRIVIRGLWEDVSQDPALVIPDVLMDKVRTIYDQVNSAPSWTKRARGG